MKKSLVLLSFIATFGLSEAKLVNEIIAVVQNEPVTAFELGALMSETGFDSREALNLIIRKKLEDSSIKELRIGATNFEIDNQISQIAARNKISVNEFKDVLKNQGIKFSDFRDDIEENIKRDKLYSSIVANITPNLESARNFYNQNLAMFSQFDTIKVIKYTALAKYPLEKISQNPMSMEYGVDIEQIVFNSQNLDDRLNYIFANTKDESFTPIMEGKKGYEMYFVEGRSGNRVLSFESVKDEVLKMATQNQRELAVNEYFDKLRSKADIKILKK